MVHEDRTSSGPVNRLSDDVLCLIFQEIFKSSSEVQSNFLLWTQTGVCKRWRDVIVGNASFWSRVIFGIRRGPPIFEPIPFGVPDSFKEECIGINLQLDRAGETQPLRINIDLDRIGRTIGADMAPMVAQTLRRIFQNFSRCVSLKFEDWTPQREYSQEVFEQFSALCSDGQRPELPNLQKLELPCYEQEGTLFGLNLHSCPRLRELSISEAHVTVAPDLTWSALQTFRMDMTNCAPSWLLTALTAACNLSHLEFKLLTGLKDQSADPHNLLPAAVTLEKLISCDIDFFAIRANDLPAGSLMFLDVLSRIQAPNLQNLVVAILTFPDDVAHACQLIRWSGREHVCSNNIVHLALVVDDALIIDEELEAFHDIATGLNEITDLLADLPSLQRLSLGDASDHRGAVGGRGFCIASTIAALQRPSQGTGDHDIRTKNAVHTNETPRRVCPNLTHLELYHFPVRMDALDAMLASRVHVPVTTSGGNTHRAFQKPTSDDLERSAPFKLTLFGGVLTHPTRLQSQVSQRTLFDTLRDTCKKRGIEFSTCGAHWEGFYQQAELLDVPTCTCSREQADEQETWTQEETSRWEMEMGLDQCECDGCDEFDDLRSDSEWERWSDSSESDRAD